MIGTCCEWLKNMLATAGEQGTAVTAQRDDDRRQFYIQARALTPWQAKTWARLLHTEPWQTQMDPLFREENGSLVAVVTVMRIPLSYCPSCGTNLTKLIKRQREEFDKLASAHQPFADN
jgi:hypothetical protein